jgi:hypothetical protein
LKLEKAKFVTGFLRWVKGQAQGLEPGAFQAMGQLDLTQHLYSPPTLGASTPPPEHSLSAFSIESRPVWSSAGA